MPTATELGLRGGEEKNRVTAKDLGLTVSDQDKDLVPDREPLFGPNDPQLTAPVGVEMAANEAAEEQARLYNRLANSVGGNFSPEPISDFDLVYDLSRSDKIPEKVDKFKSRYPEGEAFFVPTDQGNVMVARRGPNEPFHMVSNQVAEIAEPLTNLRTVGGVIGAMGRGPSGLMLNAATRVGQVAGGTMLGGAIESERERFRGFEHESRPTALSEELGIGLAAGSIDALTMGLGKLASPVVRRMTAGTVRRKNPVTGEIEQIPSSGRGIGLSKSKEQIEQNIELGKTIEATDLLGLPPLTRGQVGTAFGVRDPNPLIQGMYWQSTSTTGVGQAQLRAARKKARDKIKEWSESDFRGLSDQELGRVLRGRTEQLDMVYKTADVTQPEMGDALQTAFKNYEKASRVARDRLYEKAFTIDDSVTFDISPVKQINRGLLKGTPARGMEGQELRLKGKPKKVVRDVMKDIEDLDPVLTKYTVDDVEMSKAVEQIQDLRTRLFDARFSDHGPTRRTANALWESLSEVMDNPIGGSDEFVKAFRKARAANRIREANLEKKGIVQVLKSEDPGEVAARYIAPGRHNSLVTIRNVANQGDREGFKVFQNYFKHKLTENPAEGLKTLRRFEQSPRTLQLLLPTKRERALIKKRLEMENKILNSPVQREFEKEALAGERAMDIIRRGTAKQMKDLVESSAGGKNGELARNMKAGLFRRALEHAEESSDKTGEKLIDPIKLDNFITEIQQSDKFDVLMTNADKKVWENLRRWAAVNRGDVDAGGQIVRGEIISGATEPSRAQRALYKIGSFSLIAHILSKPALRKHLSESQDFDINKMRGFVQAMQQMEKEDSRIPEEFIPFGLREEAEER